jgi:hypothetical protein
MSRVRSPEHSPEPKRLPWRQPAAKTSRTIESVHDIYTMLRQWQGYPLRSLSFFQSSSSHFAKWPEHGVLSWSLTRNKSGQSCRLPHGMDLHSTNCPVLEFLRRTATLIYILTLKRRSGPTANRSIGSPGGPCDGSTKWRR